mmetsp:Transcript_39650/g.51124  ORF Transcript_39650/g.51124 Transcript_39650/m.51124 type:complete len:98 (+) Transcript_39650:479-772(+)
MFTLTCTYFFYLFRGTLCDTMSFLYRYIIESGMLAISKENQGQINLLGPGDNFGDIGLLYDKKRHVTVTCLSEASLWALDREPFRQGLALSEIKKKK